MGRVLKNLDKFENSLLERGFVKRNDFFDTRDLRYVYPFQNGSTIIVRILYIDNCTRRVNITYCSKTSSFQIRDLFYAIIYMVDLNNIINSIDYIIDSQSNEIKKDYLFLRTVDSVKKVFKNDDLVSIMEKMNTFKNLKEFKNYVKG
jgi:hypothetical protein